MVDPKARGPLAELNSLIRENRVNDYSSPNLALGMSPVQFRAGESRWIWAQQPPSVLNPFGTIQGGYLTVFVDELFSTAIASVLAEREWAMTAELKTIFVRSLRPGRLEGIGKVVHRSRSIAFLEARVLDESGNLGVLASSTWAVMSSGSGGR